MKLLLNDSSVLLNLLAADCLEEIAAALDWQLAICPAVRDEVKRLRDATTGEMVAINIAPLIASGVLQILELTNGPEQALYVEQAAIVDDGEAMSIAIASNRGLDLAIDDKRAANYTRRAFPQLRLWTTPEILKRWTEAAAVTRERLKEVLLSIETRARYIPPRSHALAIWWQAAR